jgi:Spy/CpxP family protein refolding chaperone
MNRLIAAGLALCLSIVVVSAQRGGGGGGAPQGVSAPTPNRLDILTATFTLDKNQSNQIKAIMDTAVKGAEPIRQQLTATYTALAAAIQTSKPAAEIDTAVKAYAAQATAMVNAETKALAQVAKTLTPTQRENVAGMDTAFNMFHGIFLNGKWNIIPDGKTY